jgi:predicted Fe-Mo cluster-binding NifX family protein
MIMEFEDGEMNDRWTMVNEAAILSQGAGPVAAINLSEKEVNMVVAVNLGPGITSVLRDKDIEIMFCEVDSRLSMIVDSVRRSVLVPSF